LESGPREIIISNKFKDSLFLYKKFDYEIGDPNEKILKLNEKYEETPENGYNMHNLIIDSYLESGGKYRNFVLADRNLMKYNSELLRDDAKPSGIGLNTVNKGIISYADLYSYAKFLRKNINIYRLSSSPFGDLGLIKQAFKDLHDYVISDGNTNFPSSSDFLKRFSASIYDSLSSTLTVFKDMDSACNEVMRLVTNIINRLNKYCTIASRPSRTRPETIPDELSFLCNTFQDILTEDFTILRRRLERDKKARAWESAHNIFTKINELRSTQDKILKFVSDNQTPISIVKHIKFSKTEEDHEPYQDEYIIGDSIENINLIEYGMFYTHIIPTRTAGIGSIAIPKSTT